MANTIKIRIQNVKSEILNETEKELVVVRNHKTYIGALFFKKDFDEILGKVFEEVIVEDEDEAIAKMIELLSKHNMIFKDTEKTIKHWGWINGLFEQMHYDF